MLSFYSTFIFLAIISVGFSFNKYSEEANSGESIEADTERPFRMLKLNELWQKAVKRLESQKLKNLMSDLKVQDKDELTLKKLKADGHDKDGIKEAQLRRTLASIIEKYGLTEHFKNSNYLDTNSAHFANNAYSDQILNKQIFRDKKLDKLWKKAEMSGLNDEQLKILKEEFRHHENKIEQYYQIINDVTKSDEQNRLRRDSDNSINSILHDEEVPTSDDKFADNSHQMLKDKHIEIKDSYRQLSERVSKASNGKISATDFEEIAVQQLWDLAQKSSFTSEELDSLQQELQHYQHRIKKLKYFEAQLEGSVDTSKYLINTSEDSPNEEKHLMKKVKELNYKVNKIHNELETRIMQRHIEL